jgi:hypothetical protein
MDRSLYHNVSRKGCVSFILYVYVNLLLIRSNVITLVRIKQQIEKHWNVQVGFHDDSHRVRMSMC